jgi:hypothetical protein
MYNEIQNLTKELDVSIKSLRQTGTAFAQAEKDYKIKVREEVLKLRDTGMAVTLINQIIYGIPSVADLRFKRDVAEAIYKANQESINVTKVKIRVLENQYDKEWGQAK